MGLIPSFFFRSYHFINFYTMLNYIYSQHLYTIVSKMITQTKINKFHDEKTDTEYTIYIVGDLNYEYRGVVR